MAVRVNGRTKGYQARVYQGRVLLASRMYSVSKHGSWDEAKRKANNWERRIRKKLRDQGVTFASEQSYRVKTQSNNQSGVSGVHYTEYESKSGTPVSEWVATWSEKGTSKNKKFRVTKNRTDDEAFLQSVECRLQMIRQNGKKKPRKKK